VVYTAPDASVVTVENVDAVLVGAEVCEMDDKPAESDDVAVGINVASEDGKVVCPDVKTAQAPAITLISETLMLGYMMSPHFALAWYIGLWYSRSTFP
jgi:hypothetical protein